MNTAELIDACRSTVNPLRIDCAGYILGVYDELAISGQICPPPNPGGATSQAVAVALKYLNEHPERWQVLPAVLIGESFKAAFPCQKSLN